MNIKLGEKIRGLRKKREVTQEKFAEYLGVTPQAVSRWESGICYPDVELLPAIANFFSVTLDELFEAEKAAERVKQMKAERYQMSVRGYKEEALAISRRIVKEFPNDYDAMSDLMSDLYDNYSENKDEIIEIGNRILADCMDENIRRGTLQTLSFTYGRTGDIEKARETAGRLTNILSAISCSEELILSRITTGDEKIKLRRRVVEVLAMELSGEISYLVNENFSPEEKIKILEKSNQILEIVFDDGDYGFYNDYLAENYLLMAESYLTLGECDKAFECLDKSADFCIAVENDSHFKFTSLLVRGLDNNPGYWHNKPSSKSYDFIHDELEKKEIYNPIRDDKRFKMIIEKLEPYAKSHQYDTALSK